MRELRYESKTTTTVTKAAAAEITALTKQLESQKTEAKKNLENLKNYAAALSHDLERLHGENAALENQYHALKRDFDKRLQAETYAATRELEAEFEVGIGRLEQRLGLAEDALARHRAWEVRLRSGVRRGCAVTAAGLSLALGAHYGGPYVVQWWDALAARIPAEHTATVHTVASLLLVLLCGLLGWALSERRQRRRRGPLLVEISSGPGKADTVRTVYTYAEDIALEESP